MPSTIPYDPSLVLANIVSDKALDIVEKISEAQAPVDAAQEDLNAMLASRRSLDMTRTELANLRIPTDALDKALKQVDTDIGGAAATLATTKANAEVTIRGLRKQIRSVHSEVETPVDYVKTEIKSMPLAADSMSMDVQYISADSQQGKSLAQAVSAFVSKSNSFLGLSAQTQVTAAAQGQVSRQTEEHDLVGTLVISVSCTHKNASVLAPFVLNVDKGIRTWNHLFPGAGDKINPTSLKDMSKIALANDTEGKKKFSILSGTTFGSSFVGMVHVLKSTETDVSQTLESTAASLQAQMDAGAWFEQKSGGFGVNATFGSEVKSLLSSQNITSHITLTSMGVIPSIVANNVKIGVKKFAEFDPKSSMEAVASLQNATVAGQSSVGEAADAARTGQKMVSLRAADIKASLSALGEIDDGENKLLDINSLMTALEDYLSKAGESTSGVPINYYLKDITKGMLAEMWVAKYYPGQYMPIQNDDTEQHKPTPKSDNPPNQPAS
ncbi:MAG: hypothetical protein L6R41_008202 [Letrouitia leprolyta]|nr:MAG: hypothetical protein L6R41_008202 [Letrouitia leprolyta]